MAAARTVKRQVKEETVEVWQQHYFSWRFSCFDLHNYLLIEF